MSDIQVSLTEVREENEDFSPDNCGTCRFSIGQGPHSLLKCRRFPPRAVVVPKAEPEGVSPPYIHVVEYLYPEVPVDEWCGEFSRVSFGASFTYIASLDAG